MRMGDNTYDDITLATLAIDEDVQTLALLTSDHLGGQNRQGEERVPIALLPAMDVINELQPFLSLDELRLAQTTRLREHRLCQVGPDPATHLRRRTPQAPSGLVALERVVLVVDRILERMVPVVATALEVESSNHARVCA